MENIIKISLPISIVFLFIIGVSSIHEMDVYAGENANTPVYINLPASTTESVDITVNEDGITQTGDDFQMLPYIIYMFAATLTIITVWVSSKRREVRKE